MRILRFCLVGLFAVNAVACSDASGSSSGGEPRYDASTPPLPEQDGGAEAAAPPSCAKDGGATWGDIYRDCFGPGEGSCGASQCHATATSPGGGVWVCGDTKDTCYTGIQVIIDNADPTMTTLYGALRKNQSCGPTCMPRASNFEFEPADLARIAAWISAGKQNN